MLCLTQRIDAIIACNKKKFDFPCFIVDTRLTVININLFPVMYINMRFYRRLF